MTTPDGISTSPTPLADRLAERVLRGPLTALIVLLSAIQFAIWVPHYLTWPWWSDHDVFATMAQGWEAGRLPYRDVVGNNFPGTIYLFWLVGKLAGWGQTAGFYALDATFVAALAPAMLVWSQRRFGRLLPGAVGYASFLGYYLGLSYHTAAQRDWQGPFFTVVGLLAAETLPGRAGRLGAAAGAAMGFAIRPQTALFWPAQMLAVARATPDANRREGVWAVTEWGVALTAGLALAFAPLASSGILGDFLRSVGSAALGGGYNRTTAHSVLVESFRQLEMKDIAVFAGVALLMGRSAPTTRRSAQTWLVALAGVWLYRPLSPCQHAYLNHARTLATSVTLAVLVALVLEVRDARPAARLAAVLLALGLGAVILPTSASPSRARESLAALRAGRSPVRTPLGYHHTIEMPLYPWRDYVDLLDYLRSHTAPETRVANALQGVPALTGPAARPSAFPAESLAWVVWVRQDDQRRFARMLEESPDSVVVWAPGELGYNAWGRVFSLGELEPVIRRDYEPEAKFGALEVWRRRRSRTEVLTDSHAR